MGSPRAAFTLIEMLVVLAIVAVLLGVTVPRLAGSMAPRQLRAAVTSFKAELEAARLFALTRQTRCRVVIDAQSGGYHVLYQPRGAGVGEPLRYEVLRAEGARPRTLGGDVRFAAVRIEPRLEEEIDQPSILFEPTGEADAAAVELSDGERSWTIRVGAATGRIEVSPGRETELLADRIDLDAP